MPVFTVIIAVACPRTRPLLVCTTLFMVVQTWFLTRDKKGEEVAGKMRTKEKRKKPTPKRQSKKGPSSFKEALTENDRSLYALQGRKDVMVKIRQKIIRTTATYGLFLCKIN